jgi:hypothetical protein
MNLVRLGVRELADQQHRKRTQSPAFKNALSLVRRYNLHQDFYASYRQIRPWWNFWMSEEQAIYLTLVDLDLCP